MDFPAQPMEWTAQVGLFWPDFNVRNGRDYGLGIWGWSPPAMFTPWGPIEMVHSDPDYGWLNIQGYADPDMDALCDDILATSDQSELESLIDQFQVLMADTVPFVTLFYADVIFAYWADAHDQWVFRKGEGIHDKLSMIDMGG